MALQAPRSQIEAFPAQIGSEVTLGSTGFPDTFSKKDVFMAPSTEGSALISESHEASGTACHSGICP